MEENTKTQQSILSQVGQALTSQGISVEKLSFCSSGDIAGILNGPSYRWRAEPDITKEQPSICLCMGETKRTKFDRQRLARCISEFTQARNVQEETN